MTETLMLILGDSASPIPLGAAGVLVFLFRWDGRVLSLCLVILVLLLCALYLLRVRAAEKRMLQQMVQRTEERLRVSEREHDVLLQSIQGLVLRFHYVTEALPDDHPSRPMLRMALQRADGLIIEARNRGEELRSGVKSEMSKFGKDGESDV